MKQEIKDKSFTHKCLVLFSKHQNALNVLLSLFFGKLTPWKETPDLPKCLRLPVSFLHHRFSKNYCYVLIELDFEYTVISGAEWETLFITFLQTFYNYPTKKK